MAAQERFRVGSGGGDRGLELSDDTSATDDRVSLTAVLDTIEQVGETSRRLSCGYFDHEIRLSDAWPRRKRQVAPNTQFWRYAATIGTDLRVGPTRLELRPLSGQTTSTR